MSQCHHHHHHHSHDPENRQAWGPYLLRVAISILIVAILIASGMAYQVKEGSENVVVTRFDRPIHVATEAGLHWKLPWPIDRANYVDMRKRTFSTPHAAALTQDKQSIILLAYVVWKVSDAEQFLKSTKTPADAQSKLESTVVSEKNTILGTYNLSTLVSTNPEHANVMDELERKICDAVRAKHIDSGIEVLQIGIKRISFPEATVDSTLEKMREERRAIAGKIRAEGQQKASSIRNEAAREAAMTQAEGTQRAGEILAEARVQEAAIYARSHSLDPGFYQFWRQMQTIRDTLGPKTTLILRNDSDLMKPIFQMPKPGNPPQVSLDSTGIITSSVAPDAPASPAEELGMKNEE